MSKFGGNGKQPVRQMRSKKDNLQRRDINGRCLRIAGNQQNSTPEELKTIVKIHDSHDDNDVIHLGEVRGGS